MMSTDLSLGHRQKLRVVIAPDSFKGSLDAIGAAEAIAAGWAERRPHDELVLLPQADGGEGTLAAIAACYPKAQWREVANVAGPDGRPTIGWWLCLPDGIAVVELAQVNGLPMMATLAPDTASTYGLGQVIAAALDDGAKALVIGLGGSASTDGAAGALCALGARLLDRDGRTLPPGGGALETSPPSTSPACARRRPVASRCSPTPPRCCAGPTARRTSSARRRVPTRIPAHASTRHWRVSRATSRDATPTFRAPAPPAARRSA